MGKKRNGFRQKIRDSLPESLVRVLKKHKCLSSFVEEYYNFLSSYVDREKVMKCDINTFSNEKTRLSSILANITHTMGISHLHLFPKDI